MIGEDLAIRGRRGRLRRGAQHSTSGVDCLSPTTPGKTVMGRGERYRITRSIALVCGVAPDGDRNDPPVHVGAISGLIEVAAIVALRHSLTKAAGRPASPPISSATGVTT